jgi:hypothetical protein
MGRVESDERKWGRNGFAGPRELAAAEPFTPGRFIRPRVMLKPPSAGERTLRDLAPDNLDEHPVDLPSIAATVR